MDFCGRFGVDEGAGKAKGVGEDEELSESMDIVLDDREQSKGGEFSLQSIAGLEST